jgi:hypothetical protein
LFGLDKDTDRGTKSVPAKAQAEATIKSLAGIEKMFVTQCEPVHKILESRAENLQRSIDDRLNNNKNINGTTANMMGLQAALKFACKSEQYISKIFSKLNSCAVQYAK